MEIRESFHLPAPRDDGAWVAVLGSQLGPIRVRFSGSLSVDDTQPPRRITATGQGIDRGTGIIQAMATEMTKEFVGCVSARFEPSGQVSPPPRPRSSPASPLRILRRAIGTWLRTRLRRLLGRADP